MDIGSVLKKQIPSRGKGYGSRGAVRAQGIWYYHLTDPFKKAHYDDVAMLELKRRNIETTSDPDLISQYLTLVRLKARSFRGGYNGMT